MGDAVISVFVRAGLVPSTYMLTTRGRRAARPLTHPAPVVQNQERRWLVAPYGAVSWVHNAAPPVTTDPDGYLDGSPASRESVATGWWRS